MSDRVSCYCKDEVCMCVIVSCLLHYPNDKAVIYVTAKPFHIVYVVPYESMMSRLD